MQKVLKKLMNSFPEAILNNNFEFIVCPETNLFFNLSNCSNEEDVKCKILEWGSRDCFKTEPYDTCKKNEEYHERILSYVNKFFETNFTQYGMEIIYNKLGNAINHDLTLKFVKSGCDFSILGVKGNVKI